MAKEQMFSEKDILLSTTDIESYIKYANSQFCDIAGYSLDELKGSPHNKVRHPDMPKAAFGDLWSFIRSGKSWMGPVKNLCKNGDYYWVNAFVTPIKNDQGEVYEYQSVRTKPSRDVVDRATNIYQQLRENKQPLALKFTTDLTAYFLTFFLIFVAASLSLVLLSSLPLFASVPLLLVSLVATVTFVNWRKKYREVVDQSKAVFDNPLMSLIYSGNNDDIGSINLALQMRRAELNAVVGRVSDVSEEVSKTAVESSDRGSDVAQILSEQRSETEQVATAIHQMSTTVQDIAKVVAAAAQSSQQGLEISHEGQSIVSETTAAINSMSEQISEVSDAINRLVRGTKSIEAVLGEISSIAEQTNLLALNAAIEAARAGDQGRGFAVVADEVRALAMRTQQSTEEINKLLSELQTESSAAEQVMVQGSKLSLECVELAGKTGEALTNINNEVDEIANMNEQIATAIEEQSVVTEQINKNIVSISDMSIKSEGYSQESAQLGESLIHQVAAQQSLVVQFRS